MALFPAARITDLHVCPMVTGIVPHVGGPVTGPCAPTVLIGGLPAARVGDILTCVGPPDVIMMGSTAVMIQGQPAARILSSCAHGGVIVLGCFTVLIGDAAGGGGGGGGGAGAGTSPQAQQLADIIAGKGPIKIEGSNEFKAETMIALAKILATPSGQEWMAQMQKNGKNVTIRQGKAGENNCAPTDGTNAKNGKGSDSVINWDPKTTSLNGFSDDVANCGNDTILFHEMVHGLHNANGDHRNGPNESFGQPPGSTSQRGEERSTVGAPANVKQPDGTTRPVQQEAPPPGNAPPGQQVDYNGKKPGENYPTENSYRRDKGIPERPSYFPTNWNPGGPPW